MILFYKEGYRLGKAKKNNKRGKRRGKFVAKKNRRTFLSVERNLVGFFLQKRLAGEGLLQ